MSLAVLPFTLSISLIGAIGSPSPESRFRDPNLSRGVSFLVVWQINPWSLPQHRYRTVPRLPFVVMSGLTANVKQSVAMLADIVVYGLLKFLQPNRGPAMLAARTNVCTHMHNS